MIGTGVFTTGGLLLADLKSPIWVVAVWFVSGLVALCGALTYGELASFYGRNGGEYQLLSTLLHPAVGFIAGWITLVVGFSAPMAASALAFGNYLHALLPNTKPQFAAIVLVIVVSVLHALHVNWGKRLQNALTSITCLLIVGFVVASVSRIPSGTVASISHVASNATSGQLAVALVFVAYSYYGWNGSVYVSGEIKDPKKNLPWSLAIGTGIVMLLYVTLNAVFMCSAPLVRLSGVVEIGHVAAISLFGKGVGRFLSALIALGLMSSVSVMSMVGPRVYEAMGSDYASIRVLCQRPGSGGPAFAIILQAVFSLGMLSSVAFDVLIVYIGVTLSLCTLLTVATIFVHRRRHASTDSSYRTWGYPVTPLIYVIFTTFMIAYSVKVRPLEGVFGMFTVVTGGGLYWLLGRQRKHPPL
jgi:APA family basic amino acid/polyamine antiporter